MVIHLMLQSMDQELQQMLQPQLIQQQQQRLRERSKKVEGQSNRRAEIQPPATSQTNTPGQAREGTNSEDNPTEEFSYVLRMFSKLNFFLSKILKNSLLTKKYGRKIL